MSHHTIYHNFKKKKVFHYIHTFFPQVKKADFIITKDDEENALNALKDEIHRMYELARDEMSKLDDRVDTLSKDVSGFKHDEFSKLDDRVDTLSKDVSALKQDELRVLKDDVIKIDTDISKVIL